MMQFAAKYGASIDGSCVLNDLPKTSIASAIRVEARGVDVSAASDASEDGAEPNVESGGPEA
jgi:hypothetical protein